MNLKKYFSAIFFAMTFIFSGSLYANENSAATASEPMFLESMTKHHQDGIEMAKMAQEKAQNKEVKEMSRKIIQDQTKDIAKLQAWKKQWHSKEDVKADVKKIDMSKLESSQGSQFDKTFLEMMSQHHQDGIQMVKGAEANLQHKEVKEFAEKAIKKQTAEVSKMDQLKSSIQ